MCSSTITWSHSLASTTVDGSSEFTHPEKPVHGGNAFMLLADVVRAQPLQVTLDVMPPFQILTIHAPDQPSDEWHDDADRFRRRRLFSTMHTSLDDTGLMHTHFGSPYVSHSKLETLCEEEEETSQHNVHDENKPVSPNLQRAKRVQSGLDILAEQKKRIIS